jgi:hypothetical protein
MQLLIKGGGRFRGLSVCATERACKKYGGEKGKGFADQVVKAPGAK